MLLSLSLILCALVFYIHFLFNKSKVVQRCLYSYRRQYSSSQWSKCCASWVLNKFEPLSICFLPQYSTPKKVFISESDQNHGTKKEQALFITFSQYNWFISQNGRCWLAITLRDKMTRALRVKPCLDSHRQRQISQSDCEITSNCGKNYYCNIHSDGIPRNIEVNK